MFGTPPIFFNAITGITTPADAYFFDGSTTSYLSTTYPLDGLTDVTVYIQGTVDAANSTYTTFCGETSSSTYFICARNDSNQLYMQVYDGTTSYNYGVAWTNDFAEHVFGFRYDSAVGPSIWVDGTELGTGTDSGFGGWPASTSLRIGGRGSNGSIFVGEMKVFKFWESALSDTDMGSQGSNINALNSDLNLNYQKTETTWTDEQLSYDATDAGNVVLTPHTLILTTDSDHSAWHFADWEGDTIYDYRMTWVATGPVSLSWTGIGAPTWDFSSNTGNAMITVTITYPRIDLLSVVDLWPGAAPGPETIDLSKATGLTDLNVRYGDFADETTLVLPTTMSSLDKFTARGGNMLDGFNTETHLGAPNLTYFWADGTEIVLDVTSLPDLDFIRYDSMNTSTNITRTIVDNVMNTVAGGSISSGEIQMDSASFPLTPLAKDAWDTLIARSWTLDMARPDGIIFTTTSTSATYAPTGSNNASTNTLKWVVSGPGLTTTTYDSNNPTMDLSASTGTATITIESSDDLATLTILWLWYSNLVDIDFEDATALLELNIRGNNTTFTPTTIDLSPLTSLEWLHADVMGLTDLNIDSNTAIDELRVHSNALSAATQDYILATLNTNAVENGTLYIGTQSGSITPTEDSYKDYIELKDKGWTIDITVQNTVDVDTYYVSQVSFREPTARMTGVHMKEDGKLISIVNDSPDYMYTYELIIPFKFRSMQTSDLYDIGTAVGTGANMQGIRWKPDGTRFFIADLGFDGIQQYTCTTAWDITGTVTHNGEFNSSYHTNELTVEFNKDGTKMWVGMFNNENVWEYTLGTAWEVVSTAPTYVATHSIGGTPAGSQHVHYMNWINEGKNLFLRMPEDNGIGDLSYYSCSTAYDLASTVTLVGSKDFLSIVWANMNAMFYIDKEKIALLADYQRDIMYMARSTEDDVWQTTTGYAYRFSKVTDTYIGVIPKSMKDFTDVSCAIRVMIGGRNSDDGLYQQFTGSTAHNFMSFQYKRNTSAGSHQVYLQLSSGGGVASDVYITNALIPDGKFHMIAFSMNATTGTGRVYIDGTFAVEFTGTFDGWSAINDSDLNYEVLQIGDRQRGGAPYAGQISHIQYYASTLTDQQLIDLSTDIDDYPTSPAPVIRLGDKRGKYFWYDLSGNDYHAGIENPELVPETQFTFRGDELLLDHGWGVDGNGTVIGLGKIDVLTTAANQYPFSTDKYSMFADWAWLSITYTISNYSTGEIRTCVDILTNDTSSSHSANGTYTDIIYAPEDHDETVKWANGATAVTSMDITDILGIVLGRSIITVATCTHPFRPTAVVGTEWAVITGCTLSVSSDLPGATGNSLKGTATGAAASQGFKNTKTIVTSTDYTVSYWAKKEGTADEQVAQSWTGFTTSPTQTITSTWTKYTHELTSNATTAVCNFYNTTATTTSGEGLFISEFNIFIT